MGELYDACLREELRTTEGDAVEAADIGSGKVIVLGGVWYGKVSEPRHLRL